MSDKDVVMKSWRGRAWRTAIASTGALVALGLLTWWGYRRICGESRALAALSESELRFRIAMELGVAVTFTLDRELRYTWVHSSQIGINEADHIGRTDYDLFDKETADGITRLYRQVLETGMRIRQDITVRSLAKSFPQDFDIILDPLRDGDGEIIGIIAAAIDITERTQVRMAVEQARAEADRANLAKSKFLAAASHDLRQPVQTLIFLLGAIKPLANTERIAKAVGMMESALDGLGGLLTSILDISRVDAGVVVPQIGCVDLSEMLLRFYDGYAPQCRQKSLRFRCRCHPGLNARTDAVLLERILRNLIENAIRYTDRGGLLVGTRRRGDHLRIDIVDSGIGIPGDKLTHIFEEFYQVANPARDQRHGLGLGLAIVSRLARLIGADVQVRSREGRGTWFSVTVPVDGSAPVVSCPSVTAEVVTGRRIMVIEDNPKIRTGLELLLESWNCEFIGVESGEEALEVGEREGWRFDAIIADHRLGAGLSGTETAVVIGKRAGRPIPTLIVTGDTAPERISEVHASGFEMMHKPVTPDELGRRMARLLRGGG